MAVWVWADWRLGTTLKQRWEFERVSLRVLRDESFRWGGWWMAATLTIGGGDIDDGQAGGGKQSELKRPELRELAWELEFQVRCGSVSFKWAWGSVRCGSVSFRWAVGEFQVSLRAWEKMRAWEKYEREHGEMRIKEMRKINKWCYFNSGMNKELIFFF